jgi:hypothetical protein
MQQLSKQLSKQLSPAAQKAVTRVRILRVLSARTGMKSIEEQFKTLMALDNEDLLDASAVLFADDERRSTNGNPR